MSFGFAVGNFVAVGKLIKDITTSLRSVGGAKEDYQEIIREFETLDKVLRSLRDLEATTGNSNTINSIIFTAISCRLPLEKFLEKTQKYEKSLGLWSSSSNVKGAKDKLRWSLSIKDDTKTLQSYLGIHLATINVLLKVHGLEQSSVTAQDADDRHTEIRAQFDASKLLLSNIEQSTSVHESALQAVRATLEKVNQLVGGDLKADQEKILQLLAGHGYVRMAETI